MVFQWSSSDSKSPQAYRILVSILADLSNVVVWIVSTRPPISNSSSPLTTPLKIVPSTPIITGITVTFMFHCFFSSLARSRYLSLFSFSLILTLWSAGTAKSTIRQVLFLWIIISTYGLLARIRLSVCITKSKRILCLSFTRIGLCIYHLKVWSN